MILIDTQRKETQVEPFRTVFETFSKLGVAVPLPLKLMSASGPLFSGYSAFMKHFADHPDLRSELRTAIRYHVASRKRFSACVEFNENILDLLCMSDDAEGLASEIPVASLPGREQKILAFVSDALFRPHLIDRERIETMTREGVSEQTLFDAVMHGALLLMMGPVVEAFTDEGGITE